ncbi:MAG: Fe-S cluster assembly protein HesB [Actinomycetota bacterium]|nr:Fe-S cluster assembly protein HesB [Actinomycetota bacterium]
MRLTENAADVVKTITSQTTESDDAGVRISQQQSNSEALGLTAVEAPQPGDEVVEDHGARVFLDEAAAQTLEQEVLDAQVDESGTVQFGVAPSAQAD